MSKRYLNAVLTVIAVLLALHLVADRQASTQTPPTSLVSASPAWAASTGIPNAAAQRKDMVDLLRKIETNQRNLEALLKSGAARVRIEGPVSAE